MTVVRAVATVIVKLVIDAVVGAKGDGPAVVEAIDVAAVEAVVAGGNV